MTFKQQMVHATLFEYERGMTSEKQEPAPCPVKAACGNEMFYTDPGMGKKMPHTVRGFRWQQYAWIAEPRHIPRSVLHIVVRKRIP